MCCGRFFKKILKKKPPIHTILWWSALQFPPFDDTTSSTSWTALKRHCFGYYGIGSFQTFDNGSSCSIVPLLVTNNSSLLQCKANGPGAVLFESVVSTQCPWTFGKLWSIYLKIALRWHLQQACFLSHLFQNWCLQKPGTNTCHALFVPDQTVFTADLLALLFQRLDMPSVWRTVERT